MKNIEVENVNFHLGLADNNIEIRQSHEGFKDQLGKLLNHQGKSVCRKCTFFKVIF